MLGSLAYSQVGINIEAPKATLDVTAKTTDGTKPEGIIAPRLTGDQIKAADAQYDTPQIGTIVYATAAVGTSTPKTVNITSPGYYYFDNTLVWVKFGHGTGTSSTEPWYNVATNAGATANTDNIYQSGNVAVGTSKPVGVFHVDGAKDNSATQTATQQLNDFVVTAAGNVGVGTTNPPTRFHVVDINSAANRGIGISQYTNDAVVPNSDLVNSEVRPMLQQALSWAMNW